MEQNASDLLLLLGCLLATMSLPIWIGIIAVLRDKAD